MNIQSFYVCYSEMTTINIQDIGDVFYFLFFSYQGVCIGLIIMVLVFTVLYKWRKSIHYQQVQGLVSCTHRNNLERQIEESAL